MSKRQTSFANHKSDEEKQKSVAKHRRNGNGKLENPTRREKIQKPK